MKQETSAIPVRTALVWILCLAALSVGARNFELGLSADGPIYSTIARYLARTGDWFFLETNVPDYVPCFADHPHLGMWLMALVFKVLPAADWSSRIYGHFFYVAFLLSLFLYLRKTAGEKVAVWTVILLWICSRFSNPFSNVYLDPGAIFFGFTAVFLFDLSLREKKAAYAVYSGICLGLCALTKGIMVLGFGPSMALVLFFSLRRDGVRSLAWRQCALTLLPALAICLLYVESVRRSRVPDFLSIYWSRQMTNRFSGMWDNASLFGAGYWRQLLKDSTYLLPFALVAPFRRRFSPAVLLPLCLSVTFILMYAPKQRAGGQYWLPILPGIAWLVADGIFSELKVAPAKLVRATAGIALVLVALVQYLPLRTHGMPPAQGEDEIKQVARDRGLQVLIMDGTPYQVDFINSSRYAWWSDIRVNYVQNGDKVPPARTGAGYLLFWPEAWELRRADMTANGWCLFKKFEQRSLWLKCEDEPTART